MTDRSRLNISMQSVPAIQKTQTPALPDRVRPRNTWERLSFPQALPAEERADDAARLQGRGNRRHLGRERQQSDRSGDRKGIVEPAEPWLVRGQSGPWPYRRRQGGPLPGDPEGRFPPGGVATSPARLPSPAGTLPESRR